MNTLDIQAKEWLDRINGNSYFSAIITIDYGLKPEKTINLPFQYGHGDHYLTEARAVLTEHNYISAEYGENLRMYCERNKIVYRRFKQTGCLKKEL